MTIMVAGGMTFAAPGMMPAAHAANANLFVSAENSQFNNYFGGGQVIEIVINDPDIKDTDESKGEPDVTVNGKIVRMVQATDGLWYAYFTDKDTAIAADNNQQKNGKAGQGLDYGVFCSNDSTALSKDGEKLATDTDGITLPIVEGHGTDGSGTDLYRSGTHIIDVELPDEGNKDPVDPDNLIACNTSLDEVDDDMSLNNVVREAKTPVAKSGNVKTGQIGIHEEAWPFIQLYELNPTGNVIVQYNKGGNPQTVTLTFDTLDGTLGASLDRDIYPQGSAFHVTLTDQALNIDPTDEDSWTFSTGEKSQTRYQLFNESGGNAGACCNPDNDPKFDDSISADITGILGDLFHEDGGILMINVDQQEVGTDVIKFQDNGDQIFEMFKDTEFKQPVTLVELGPNSGIFANYDELDRSNMVITDNAKRGTSATLTWDDTGYSAVVGFDSAAIDIQPVDDEWSSGEEIPVVLKDADANKNSRFDEDLDLNNPNVGLIPSIQIGSPLTLESVDKVLLNIEGSAYDGTLFDSDEDTVEKFSHRAMLELPNDATLTDGVDLVLQYKEGTAITDIWYSIGDNNQAKQQVINSFNYDIRSMHDIGLKDGGIDELQIYVTMAENTEPVQLLDNSGEGKFTDFSGHFVVKQSQVDKILDESKANSDSTLKVLFRITGTAVADPQITMFEGAKAPIVADFFSFGFSDDGEQSSERITNMIVRLELEESGDNTGEFEGSLEYVMLNQLNILDIATYDGLGTISDSPTLIVYEDFTDEDSIRVNYNDVSEDGTELPVADQQAAPSHSGSVSFNLDTYKVADTVVVTLEDLDLNVDSDLKEIYTIVTEKSDRAYDSIGKKDLPSFSWGAMGNLLNITFDDANWRTPHTESTCKNTAGTALSGLVGADTGLGGTGFTLVESGKDSGVFVGDFAVPSAWCRTAGFNDETPADSYKATNGKTETTTGLDIEVNYIDFRDASGEIIEVGDGAGIRANTGSVSLDRTVYPVPFGVPDDFGKNDSSSPDGRALFPVHSAGITGPIGDGEFLASGDLTVHVRINDPDFDLSPDGEDSIAVAQEGSAKTGPLKVSVIRSSNTVVLGYAGGPEAVDNKIWVGDAPAIGTDKKSDDLRQFGPIKETAPDSGIFELDLSIAFTDGPADSRCPATTEYRSVADPDDRSKNGDPNYRFTEADGTVDVGEDYCILQGDILQVEYTDPTDASGDKNTVTDSATFDLRNGVLQTDKSVYIIGGDMILTLIEPDLDLENDAAETYDLDLIEWDSDAAALSMGDIGGGAFDPEPTDFRETGDSTGIFQVVIEIPQELNNDSLERGEEIVLEYTDWGPSGSDYVGDEDEDVNVTVYTSNFGATIELDQKVYTWTDKVYITVVAPDHNFDGGLVDEIGQEDTDPIKISTRGHDIDNYKLVETGTDTGIFTGEIILVGFEHDADGDASTGENETGFDKGSQKTSDNQSGPTDGFLETDDDDGITVSFEFSEDETVVGSALIRWNIGEVQWLEASYPASGTGVVRIIDPDMNLDPEAVDNFDVDVWSDSDAGGIDLTVTETNEATGIFEGTVFFTIADESSGHRLRVAEGDTVTAEYEDNTLPDPYTTADELDITATSLIGTVVPPLERAPAANLRTVDAFDNSLDTVSVDQQVQITADLANGQDRDQSFAYLVQVQDNNGVTVSLAWITGQLGSGQSLSPALSWIPTEAGTYTATAFVWESVNNPTALSPQVTTTITVN